MKRNTHRTFAFLAVGAFLLSAGGSASAAICGNGVLEPGEQCDPPVMESCVNGMDDDGDLLVDCLDPDCAGGQGASQLCGAECVIVPACVPPLRDPAKMVFNLPKRLDTLAITAHVVPTTEASPDGAWSLSIANTPNGVLYTQSIADGMLLPKPRQRWVYLTERTGLPMIYKWVAKRKFDKKTQTVQYLLKIKMEADFANADPDRNTMATEDELETMTLQITMGDDVFSTTAGWERKHSGWYLPNHHVDPVP